jgi:hypothetical protein
MRPARRAFTLLELLASVTLLVILGALLFEVFSKASEVVRITNSRQEIFQYARAALEFMEREISGSFTSVDGDPSRGNKGFRVYAGGESMGSDARHRVESEGMFFSTGIIARDTREKLSNGSDNPFFGHDVNVARISYYLNNETEKLEDAAVFRGEVYNLTQGDPETGEEFVRNCLNFRIFLLNQFEDKPEFKAQSWNSDENVKGMSRRQGLPRAVQVLMRMTDERHANMYEWDSGDKKWNMKEGFDPATDDPVIQSFTHTIYMGRRSD